MPSNKPPTPLRIPAADERLLDALVEELSRNPGQVPYPVTRNRVAIEAMSIGVATMIGRMPLAAQRRIGKSGPRRFKIHIRTNAITSGFPTGGPYVRSGIPPLADGEYHIVEHADGTWRYGDCVVLQRVFPRP